MTINSPLQLRREPLSGREPTPVITKRQGALAAQGNSATLEENALKWFLGYAFLAILPALALAQSPSAGQAPSPSTAPAATAILASQCLSCHGPDQKKGGLDLSRRAAALKGGKTGVVLVPGSPDESMLINKIADGEMPPKAALAPGQIETVRKWVQAGAFYPASRSFRPAPAQTGGHSSQ